MTGTRGYCRLEMDLAWEGAVNARPIAGSVFRMGRREWLTEQGWRQMRESGIRRIIDLRNPDEIKLRPTDPRVPSSAAGALRVLNLPLERIGNPRFESVAIPYMNHPSMYQLVCEEFPELLLAVFKELSTSAEPTVLHCSAGRDRSGLVASILLDLAGRRDAVLEHDARATRGINEWHRVSTYKHPYEGYQQKAQLERDIAQRAEALSQFMDWLGSTRDFLGSHGLSTQELDALQAMVSTQQDPDTGGR